jgi:hypothetical protein
VVAVQAEDLMLFQAVRLTLKVSRRMEIKPWSREARALMRLIRSAAKRASADAPRRKLTREERVVQAAHNLAESKKARQRIADTLKVSEIDAWMVQQNLKRALNDLKL